MARQRRGRGGTLRPELRGTLGTLLRTTREVLERGAREGRERVEGALASRRRDGALAELGEIVLDLIRRGEIDVAELPEVRDVVTRLDDLDAGGSGHEHEHAPPPTSAGRSRFDRRTEDDGTVAAATWTPPNRKQTPADPPPEKRVWRPSNEPTIPAMPAALKNRERKGGIQFDEEDSDLADYMHPDDVPPKDPSSGSSGTSGPGSNS